MMMMTQVPNHKRRNHEEFLISNAGDAVKTHRQSNSDYDQTLSFANNEKRHRGGFRGANISSREKKDKVGERVTKLQQLVSPFGKTDTASVLDEATAYIKFLHDQLQVLSTPYLRTAPEKLEDIENHSLRSRGLCLVPVDAAVGITQDNGADIWAPVHATKNR